MLSERWQQVEHVYHAVISRPELEWSSAVGELCAGDEALRHEVESLLAHERAASGFLETPAAVEAGAAAVPTFIGRRVGPYSVRAPLGAGGMGEVYRASDEQLRRDVAIKILPPHFASHPGRLARFQNEARMLAALNHPNIGAIYGHELVDGSPALVLELVEGETLSQRIARHAGRGLPVHDALTIARQIAEALEAAHGRGIVHRDLKPANVKITPGGVVKVLDFGLAKLAAGEDEEPDARAAHGPTVVSPATRDGLVLGTIAYMSPEQAAGIPADTRSDLWSLGVVLMEMLTGRPVFPGSTDSGLLSGLQSSEPDWAALPADTPEPVRSLLRQCLEKDRARRLDSAGAVRLQIDEVLAPAAAGTAAGVPSRRVALMAMAALSVVLITAVASWTLAPRASKTPGLLTRLPIVTPPAQPLNADSPGRDLAVSPDGRHLVYRFGGSATTGAPLAVRPTDRLDARALAGTGHAYAPFFSFDGLWIGFFENDELKKVSIDGGPVVPLCAVIGQPRGASWGVDDMIVFATDDPATGLLRVPAKGGKPTVLTTPVTTQPGNDHVFPSVLPDGAGVLFTVAAAGSPDTAQLAALDLKTSRWNALGRTGNQPEYVDRASGGSGEGFLVYAAAGALHAERFDPVRRTPLGKPVTVEEHVMTKPSGAANYAVSRQGTLVFMPPRGADEVSKRTLVWVDRKGLETPIDAPPRAYGPSRISPDGTRVAVGIDDSGNTDIWILDLATGKLTRLTDAPGIDALPLWTPDGRRLVFTSDRKGVSNLYIVNADGSPPVVTRLTTSASRQWPTSIDRDRNLILGHQFVGPAMTIMTMAVHLSPDRPPEDLFRGNFAEISPNSRYLTYRSGASGIFVRSYPSAGRPLQIATGTRSMWSRGGNELFYLEQSGALMVMSVDTSGPTFTYGEASKLFDTASRYVESKSNPSRHYDVSPDGSRFLMIKEPAPDPSVTPASIVVVQQWTEELKERVR